MRRSQSMRFGHSRSPMVIEADQMFPPIGEPNSLQSWIADQRSGRWQPSRREAPERTRHEDVELHPGWHRDHVDELCGAAGAQTVKVGIINTYSGPLAPQDREQMERGIQLLHEAA